jgi:MFS family permease
VIAQAAPSIDSTSAAPATPAYDRAHGIGCAVVSVVLGLTQSLTVWGINNNLPAVQGALGATALEASWLSTAYFATALSAIVPLTKVRLQFGLVRFATWGLAVFVAVALWYLLSPSLATAIAARAALGFAATPLTALAILYMIEAVPPALAPVGAVLGFGTFQLGSPLARIIAQPLFDATPGTGVPMFHLALALVALAAIHAVPQRPVPLQKVFTKGDLPAFVLYAIGLACLCVFVTQGRPRWWTDTPWLGPCLCAGIVSFGAYLVLDLWCDQPMIDWRWVASRTMRWFLPSVIAFRIALSEQPAGAIGLMTVLGVTNDQMHTLFAWVTVATIAGFAIVVVGIALRSLHPVLLAALALIVIASLMDADATSLTRPQDILASQILIGVATAMFLGASFVLGLLPVVLDGQRNIVSFVALLVGGQYMGSLIGAAWLGTYVNEQQQVHVARLVQTVTLTDPQVAIRAAQGAAAQAGVIVDPTVRRALGTATLSQQVAREAWVLAYEDLFRRVAAVAALTFVCLATYWSAQWWRDRTTPSAAVASGVPP